MPRKITSQALELLKEFEGFSDRRYICPGGVDTIGYGHAIRPGEVFSEPITMARGLSLLVKDAEAAGAAVERLVTAPLNDNQFAALVSFTFNLGQGHLASSTLLKRLNAGDYQAAADEFPKWRKAGGVVLDGLVRRRAAERALFITPMEQSVAGDLVVAKEATEPAAPFPEKEDKTMPSWMISMLVPAAIKIGSGVMGSLVQALLPESAKSFGQHVSEKTKAVIKQGLDQFQEYADSTPSDNILGQMDNVLANLLFSVADGLGLLPAPSSE